MPANKMMISALAALLTMAVSPAFAAGWDTYLNDRYGYEVAVPPGFTGQGEADAHDGQVFRGPKGTQKLTVWGGFLLDTKFSADVKSRLDDLAADGWTASYQSTTPGWASYSGTKGQRVIYFREISGCKGEQYAVFQLEYPIVDIGRLKPVVDRLVPSLKQTACEGN